MNTLVNPKLRINLESAHLLLLEQSDHGVELLAQIFMGFGARNLHRSTTSEDAMEVVKKRDLDLIIVDPNLRNGDGHDFVRWLRRSGLDPSRSSPVVMVSTNATKAAIARARDAGVSFFVAKPLTPAVLVDRIMRVTRDNRTFVLSDNYAGPDRRFKFEGLPPGVAPRRAEDLKGGLSDSGGPAMSQSDIDAMFKPQKVSL